MVLTLITILGVFIGSFLNVCIHRIPLGKSVVYNSSHCPQCRTSLKFYDLIPVVSYLVLGGKCRYCHGNIKLRYPMIELFTGVVYLVLGYKFYTDIQLLKYLFLFSVLIVIFFIDLQHKIIPDGLVIIIMMWGIIWQFFTPEISWVNAIGGALLGGGTLLVLALITEGGFGGGDIKLMFAIGMYFGVLHTLLTLFLAFITGGLFGIVLILMKGYTRKDFIAFAPFLILGIVMSILCGDFIIRLYRSLW
ncbi:type II secretory pathway, prepilin signal peptidase PulO [Clostridium aceticum]|uniref:Type II secretory pathway, prepilin signal peptidase PulO n=1 Tax=Clostridium aceticum TaxID=84022 RepID=A0A0D8ICL6_9CLOT|nr:A24 family peptidase [Clostridium aceticum]AKL96349.1 type II secretory pathway, prepilin signal peptidase PulO [Clostridium aceticum]KJF26936.1 hypothetical protein TZ02_10400 [Clostridium aceticum]